MFDENKIIEEDIFIVKFNSGGDYQWSKRLGGFNFDSGYGIATDSNGSVIVTGSVDGDADLNGDGDNTDGGAESAISYTCDKDVFIVF